MTSKSGWIVAGVLAFYVGATYWISSPWQRPDFLWPWFFVQLGWEFVKSIFVRKKLGDRKEKP